jgi:hypothetical protein
MTLTKMTLVRTVNGRRPIEKKHSIVLNVILSSVVMLSVIRLIVVAPKNNLLFNKSRWQLLFQKLRVPL